MDAAVFQSKKKERVGLVNEVYKLGAVLLEGSGPIGSMWVFHEIAGEVVILANRSVDLEALCGHCLQLHPPPRRLQSMDPGVRRGGVWVGNAGPDSAPQSARCLPPVTFARESKIPTQGYLRISVKGPTVDLFEWNIALLRAIPPDPDDERISRGSGTVPGQAPRDRRYTRF